MDTFCYNVIVSITPLCYLPVSLIVALEIVSLFLRHWHFYSLAQILVSNAKPPFL